MIKSMTGFGRGEAGSGGFRVTVELRSVNHRFAEARVRVPSDLAGLEAPLQQRVLRKVARGRVDATVNVARDESSAALFEVNRAAVASSVRVARSLKEEFGLDGGLSVSTLLSLPEALRGRQGSSEPSADERKALYQAFDAALDAHDAMRSREGQIMARDLGRRVTLIRKLVRRIARKAPAVAARQADRLRERVEELMGKSGVRAPVDPARLAQEAAILADRSDITEEIVRLEGHLEQIEGLLKDSEPVGKRLDFLMQELNREANTINSKSGDLEIGQAAIEIKAEIEKLREQVQNVE